MNPAQRKINTATSTLWLIVILTIVNSFTMFGGTYFLFSAFLPQIFIGLAVEYPSLTMNMIILSFVYIFPYLLSAIFAKKKKGWLIFAYILFVIDSTLFILGFMVGVLQGDYSLILDLVVRVYALVTLKMGITGFKELKNNANKK